MNDVVLHLVSTLRLSELSMLRPAALTPFLSLASVTSCAGGRHNMTPPLQVDL